MASRVVSDAAHKDGFVAIASKSGGSIGGATASAEEYFIDIDFGTKFELIKKSPSVGAKIVMINEIDVLQSRTDAYNT